MRNQIVLANYNDFTASFTADGWINATVAAERFGKRVDNWQRTDETKHYIAALAKHLNTSKMSDLIKTRRGRNGGTWLHPKLAINFARWLSPDFAVWCDLQIEALLTGTHPHYNQKLARHDASVSHKLVADMLTMSRAADGKSTKAHHYANETRMINFIVTGEFKPLDRHALDKPTLDLLAKLERHDALLIAKGLGYEERKEALTQFALSHRHTRIH